MEDRLRAFVGMTAAEFLGKPKITSDANARDLRPSGTLSDEGLPKEPFMECTHGTRYQAIHSARGVTVFDTEKQDAIIGSYNNYGRGSSTLVVDKKYRRQGIGMEIMYQWRMRNPAADLGDTRTKKSQALQKKVWQRIQCELRSLLARDYLDEKTKPTAKTAPKT